MSLILRGQKGSKLTTDELDGNFQYLEGLSGNSGLSIQQICQSQIDLSLTPQEIEGKLLISAGWNLDYPFNEGDTIYHWVNIDKGVWGVTGSAQIEKVIRS